MAESKTDAIVLGTIKKLVDEENAAQKLDPKSQARLQALHVELDQCWDLLRQRRALREFGQDPDKAQVRPPDVVEKYEQ